MPIKTLPRYLLLSEELAEAGSRFRATLEPFSANDPVLKRLLDLTGSAVDTALTAFGLVRGNSLTKTVFEKDEIRDGLYADLAKYIRGSRAHYLPAKAEAGALLYGLFKKHGFQLQQNSYAVESSKLKALFVDLENDNAKKAAEELGITQAIADLVRAENDFAEVHRQLVSSKAVEKVPTVSEIVGPLRRLLLNIINYLGTMEYLEPEKWSQPVSELNVVITELAAKARARKSRGAAVAVEEEVGQNAE
jgi:hypothetical protein